MDSVLFETYIHTEDNARMTCHVDPTDLENKLERQGSLPSHVPGFERERFRLSAQCLLRIWLETDYADYPSGRLAGTDSYSGQPRIRHPLHACYTPRQSGDSRLIRCQLPP